MTSSVTQRAIALLTSVGLIWAVSFYSFTDDAILFQLALVPRSADGLLGVISMPFVHESLTHLIANSVPLLALGAMLMIRGPVYYLSATLAIVVLGGLAVWLFGREAAHVGASGLVFGLFAFLITRGLYDRRPVSIAIALGVFAVYGGMIWGVMPQGDGISWEAHSFGLVAGAITARAFVAVDFHRRRQRASDE